MAGTTFAQERAEKDVSVDCGKGNTFHKVHGFVGCFISHYNYVLNNNKYHKWMWWNIYGSLIHRHLFLDILTTSFIPDECFVRHWVSLNSCHTFCIEIKHNNPYIFISRAKIARELKA